MKKVGNPAQEIYKLMLNSSYGKTIETIHDTDNEIVNNKDYNNFFLRHFDAIKSTTRYGDKHMVITHKEVCDQYAMTYIGARVLSVSKRIMNEVMCLAEDNNI